MGGRRGSEEGKCVVDSDDLLWAVLARKSPRLAEPRVLEPGMLVHMPIPEWGEPWLSQAIDISDHLPAMS